METILIVDDEKNYPLILSAVLEEEGFETITANSGIEALEVLDSSDIDLVLTDMAMPSMTGMELLDKIKDINSEIPVIMMTAHGTVDKAVEAMLKGAYNYILKPFDNENLIIHIKKAMDLYKVVKENRELRRVVQSQFSFNQIIGKSKLMLEIYDTIEKVAPTLANILVEGESGTGKELIAKSIHFNSQRVNKPFIAVNCSAFAESLLESELFGHEKGAFTGATSKKKGRFELAEGGTLFLDEIGELSMNLQVKLLRVLQDKVIERVGAVKPIKVDFRLIAATNKVLKKETEKGNFREDLFYRLNVVRIALPPLRDRKEDIQLLLNHFIDKYSKEHSTTNVITGIDQNVQKIFFDYHWPGNIRELENVIERAMILSSEDKITISDLPKEFKSSQANEYDLNGIPSNASLYEALTRVEIKMIQRALSITNNIQSHAAKLLGIGKSGLNQKIKKHGIQVGSK